MALLSPTGQKPLRASCARDKQGLPVEAWAGAAACLERGLTGILGASLFHLRCLWHYRDLCRGAVGGLCVCAQHLSQCPGPEQVT